MSKENQVPLNSDPILKKNQTENPISVNFFFILLKTNIQLFIEPVENPYILTNQSY